VVSDEITTTPDLNWEIVNLLRMRDDPTSLYAAARIEELEDICKTYIEDEWQRRQIEAAKQTVRQELYKILKRLDAEKEIRMWGMWGMWWEG